MKKLLWEKLLQGEDNKLSQTGNFSYRINKYPIQTITFALNRGTNNDLKFISKFLLCEKFKFFVGTNFRE